MFTGGDFHQLRDGGGFCARRLVDHHGNDHRMCVRRMAEKTKAVVTADAELFGARFTDRKSEDPFPNSPGAREARNSRPDLRGQQLDCCRTRCRRLRKSRDSERHSDRPQETSHRRTHFRAARS